MTSFHPAEPEGWDHPFLKYCRKMIPVRQEVTRVALILQGRFEDIFQRYRTFHLGKPCDVTSLILPSQLVFATELIWPVKLLITNWCRCNAHSRLHVGNGLAIYIAKPVWCPRLQDEDITFLYLPCQPSLNTMKGSH